MTGAASYTTELLDRGFCVIPDLLPPQDLARLDADLDPVFRQTPMGQGYFYGFSTKRIGSLLRRSPIAAKLVLHPTILAIVEDVLGAACERVQLNVAQAIEIHPGEIEQFPHCDHDMWAGVKGHHEYLVNVMWPISDFTALNGATRIYPGTHRGQLESLEDLPEPIVTECEAGSAICFLGSTVHGAGANLSPNVRRGVVIGYSLGWLKPYENPWLAYPPEVARQFSPELASLVGYSLHRPNLGNYEGQCPSILLAGDVPEFPRATDALRPDQEAAVAAFAQGSQDRS
ncbi:phytanoyl-CoA dioxygenase family protein [Novosphingobium sp.]|uniref:phytanoyl-CoA dioxygenase family protein n=1 Tax=Novosphingobium sp. TaxID=1874826 RepID=UPI00286D6FF8|nr:phytanoyl-CoA dioxygenase family protein [Novosphingobium sp.]